MTTQMDGLIPIEALEHVRDRGTLFAFLHEQLGWPVNPEDTFTYDEPALAGKAAARVDVSRIVPFGADDPFIIMLAEFQTTLRRSDLRAILQSIRREMRTRAAYQGRGLEEIIFVCATEGYQGIRFAHFKEVEGRQPRLSVFGWDRERVAETRTLREVNLPALRLQANLYGEPDWDADTITRWRDAWDVDSVTQKFFDEFHLAFTEVKGVIGQASPGVAAGDLHTFTLTLMNRLLFCWFIQQKKWLNHETAYLSKQWTMLRQHEGAGFDRAHSFYDNILIPLFLHMLNTPPNERDPAIAERMGEIPYLNGGLFCENDLDRLAHPNNPARKIIVPNVAIARLLSERPAADRRAEGLFLRWHFTIEEGMPDDVDVAVDPEMLGKVFEELMNEVTSRQQAGETPASGKRKETKRHETGAYYTPRPVVSFMCREGLKGYLGNDEAIAKFVDENDASLLTDPEQVLIKLQRVRACDPACGSGAYLLGMLQELIRLRRALFATRRVDPRSDYQRKLEIIRHNLYGVDIEPSAVEIARLRLWLSLVVEFDDGGDLSTVPALPNLDFKIEQGNSLFAPNPQGEEQQAFADEEIRKFAALKAQYASATDPEEKQQLLGEIDHQRRMLRDIMGHTQVEGFDWAVEFAEVFAPVVDNASGRVQRGGFDIVLANPPYVRQELIRDQKPKLRHIFGDLFCGTADLYVFFYYRALQLLKRDGMLVFISSNKWMRAGYGAKLRAHIAGTTRVRSITDFGELPVFQTAATFPMIIVAQKGAGEVTTCFTQVQSLDDPYPDVRALIDLHGNPLPGDALNGDTWRLTDANTASLLRKMEAAGTPLGEYINGKIYHGILTGFNDAFVIDNIIRAELIAADPRSAEIIKPLAVGDDVRKWRIENRGRWLIVTPIGINIRQYPAIFAHLRRWQDELEARWDKGNHWWELRACDYYSVFNPDYSRRA